MARRLIAQQSMRGANQLVWCHAEAIRNPVNHSARGKGLGSLDRNRWLDVDDHRIVKIHHIVGGVREEGCPAICPCPARGRINRLDVFGNHFGRRAESCVIQCLEIFIDNARGQVRWQTFLAINATGLVRIRGDQTGIDAKTFTANQALINAALQYLFEEVSEQSALPEPTMPVLREG